MDPDNTKRDDMPAEKKRDNKRPPGEFALFAKANYSKVLKENPTMTAPDVMRQIAIMWKEHSE
jgi:hypothetical protein